MAKRSFGLTKIIGGIREQFLVIVGFYPLEDRRFTSLALPLGLVSIGFERSGFDVHSIRIASIAGLAHDPVEHFSNVIGRAKPASGGRAKTGHFEKAEIRPLSLASGSRRERTMGWRINSRWPKFKQF